MPELIVLIWVFVTSTSDSSSTLDATSTLGSAATFITISTSAAVSSTLTLESTTSAETAESASSTATTELTTTAETTEPTTSAVSTTAVESPTVITEITTSAEITESTTSSASSLQTLALFVVNSNDPFLFPVDGQGSIALESYRGSSQVFYLSATASDSTSTSFTLDPNTGALTVVSGPGSSAGQLAYSNTGGESNPYTAVLISPQDYASSRGNEVLDCSLDSTNKLSFQWGTAGSADFWMCARRLHVVQPGYDFKYACPDATISFKVDVYVGPV
ncbi:CMGC protein kinase [Fusarium austroafricanum]|uniref:CMGC protein kinase n=1 Tax=Fusarium austroafricanum TaxID=2364996 RepID=A0A8H4NUG4_9HYPO|nr:CMGC protein kinase [Fusarium austroafricanum]